MTSIESVTLEVADPTAARRFYTAAFGLGPQLLLRASEAPATGFRGFTLSLTVSQPATVSALIGAALDAGATPLKPAAKSLWGYGGVVQAPDGTIWKVATSSKKDTGPATRQIDQIVLLLGAADVAASKRFYVDRGLAVAKSFGRKYVEFTTSSSPVKLALYGHRALAKDAGVPPTAPDRTGSRLAAMPGPSPTRTGSRGRPQGAGDVVCRETGDQTGQESRSAGHGATTSVKAMDITIHASSLPHDDPDASLAFYRDILGFEVRADVGSGQMRWITVGPPGQPGTSILLAPPAADPGITDDERRTITEMMAKGTYGWILLATKDLDSTFARLQAGAEVVQEPTEQPYGIRDCAVRDPAGNLIRIQELR